MSAKPSGHHLAAILPSKGARLETTYRPTPAPGPNEVLIEVKSVAINPADHVQRDTGLFITNYPVVLGSDVAGTIIAIGSSVTAKDLKVGTRVAAFASAYFAGGAPDYGALQEYVLVAPSRVVPLPQSVSFNEGSILPMAVATAWNGWHGIGLARDTKYTAADRQGMLVWGGASSVGSAVVQIAKLMGFVVYVTASEKHHEYLKTLGASRAFDYKDEDVVRKIVNAAKEDGIILQTGYNAIGGLEPCMEILKQSKGEQTAKLASAAILTDASPKVEGVDARNTAMPTDVEGRVEHFSFIFNVWLKEKLANGEFVPSPKIQVVDGGLEAADKGFDESKKGVSGVKLVLEV